jgi:hypothetical protein
VNALEEYSERDLKKKKMMKFLVLIFCLITRIWISSATTNGATEVSTENCPLISRMEIDREARKITLENSCLCGHVERKISRT